MDEAGVSSLPKESLLPAREELRGTAGRRASRHQHMRLESEKAGARTFCDIAVLESIEIRDLDLCDSVIERVAGTVGCRAVALECKEGAQDRILVDVLCWVFWRKGDAHKLGRLAPVGHRRVAFVS